VFAGKYCRVTKTHLELSGVECCPPCEAPDRDPGPLDASLTAEHSGSKHWCTPARWANASRPASWWGRRSSAKARTHGRHGPRDRVFPSPSTCTRIWRRRLGDRTARAGHHNRTTCRRTCRSGKGSSPHNRVPLLTNLKMKLLYHTRYHFRDVLIKIYKRRYLR